MPYRASPIRTGSKEGHLHLETKSIGFALFSDAYCRHPSATQSVSVVLCPLTPNSARQEAAAAYRRALETCSGFKDRMALSRARARQGATWPKSRRTPTAVFSSRKPLSHLGSSQDMPGLLPLRARRFRADFGAGKPV